MMFPVGAIVKCCRPKFKRCWWGIVVHSDEIVRINYEDRGKWFPYVSKVSDAAGMWKAISE